MDGSGGDWRGYWEGGRVQESEGRRWRWGAGRAPGGGLRGGGALTPTCDVGQSQLGGAVKSGVAVSRTGSLARVPSPLRPSSRPLAPPGPRSHRRRWARGAAQEVLAREAAGAGRQRLRGSPRGRLGPQPGGRGPTPCGRRPVQGGPLSARLSPSGDATQAIRLRLPLLKRFDQNRRPCRAEPRWPQSGTPRCGF